ncbi:MFS transporter [Paenisporosarcina quisquiliarum]|uniref:MFS transporter n=1 Tax=Paenisporosarcina quisquiliarum TaxID=365346 RepID=A0A9X3LI78_9BACL|nr:MFS transporter [Paenisporosarcina quisquiliarum]MCZ8538423.1 MFS transporter [Paenisporosarcina quisquiliarum]
MVNWITDWKMKITGFNRNIRMFMLANVLIQIGMGVFMVMYNLYIKELGLSEVVNGKVISYMSLATAIVLIPAGFLSDRVGRKWSIAVGTLLTASTLFYRSVVVSEEPIVIAAFFTGLFMAIVQVSGVPFLAENSKASERMHLFSIHFSVVTIASVIGSLGGGVLADVLEFGFGMNAVDAIRWALLAGATIFTIGIVPLLKLKPKMVSEDAKREAAINLPSQDSSFKINVRIIVLFAIAQLLIGIGSGLVIPYLNLYFANRFDASSAFIGLVLSLGSAMTAVAMLIGPMLVKKVGKVNALVLFQLGSLPFLFLTAFTTSVWLASAGFLMRQALMNAGNPIQSAIAMEVVHDKYKGLANSVNQMVFNIGWAVMGPVSAWLVTTYGSYWGYAYAFSITGFLYILSSSYFYIAFGRRKHIL